MKHINNPKIWTDGTLWYNHCPNCNKIRKFKTEKSVYNTESMCYKCSNSLLKQNKDNLIPINQLLIDSGRVWFDQINNKWCSKCPTCVNIKTSAWRSNIFRNMNRKCKCCTIKSTALKRIGYKHSEETKQKIGDAQRGEKSICFGVPLSDDIKRKMSATTRGIPKSPAHFDKIQKSAFKRKEFIFPDGRIEKVQGYEPLTLNYLLTGSINPDMMMLNTKDKPVVSYYYDGCKHNYFPDCYLKDTNTIVETKSTWTWENEFDRNQCKLSASIDAGYNMRLIIWDKNKQLTTDITYDRHN